MSLKNRTTDDNVSDDFSALFQVDGYGYRAQKTKNSRLNNIKKKHLYKNPYLVIYSSALLLLAIMIISICIGRYPLSISAVLSSLINGVKYIIWEVCSFFSINFSKPEGIDDVEMSIVWLVRLPRVIAAVLVGGALSFSGSTYQSLFRNPMVSPDILGASAGASVGACLMMLMNQNTVVVQIGAFVFGIIAVLISYLLSKTVDITKDSVLVLILCGMTIGALFQAILSIIKYLADPDSQLPEMTYWLMGSIAKVDYNDIGFFLLTIIVSTIPILVLSWKLNVVSMGYDDAKAIGVNVSLVRVVCIVCATLLTASVVSYAGTIGWVGLMIPHLCRFVVGSNNRYLLPLSFLSGSLFLLLIDNLCRSLFAYEIPLGVLTSILGTPFFVFILCKRKGER